MKPADEPPNSGMAERLEGLEIAVTHLERTVADLNGAILAQQKSIDALERKLGRLTTEFNTAQNAQGEERKPEDEKPPHY
jgi:uncharacterized coiled-coil protein SlyX